MDRREFKRKVRELGFDVSKERGEEDELPVICAENENGDRLWWSVLAGSNDWGVYVEPDNANIDSNDTFRPEEVGTDGGIKFRDDYVVVENVSGTVSKRSGFGRKAYDGELRIDREGTDIVEVTRR